MAQMISIPASELKDLKRRLSEVERKVAMVGDIDPRIVDPEVPHIKLSKRAEKRFAKADADIKAGKNLITADNPEDLLKYLRR